MRIKGDQFSIENEVARKPRERVDDLWKTLVEHFLVARKQRDLSSALYRDAAIAVEFDLKSPLRSSGQRGDRLAMHRLDEGWFRGFPNCPWRVHLHVQFRSKYTELDDGEKHRDDTFGLTGGHTEETEGKPASVALMTPAKLSG